MSLTSSRIRSILEPYYPNADLEICSKVQIYIDLLLYWNKRISLTAISSEEEIVRFHFGESIFSLTLEDFNNGRLADVGSGAGFPGYAIKLFRPDVKLTLIEPNKKKCTFLNEVSRKVGFSEIEVIPATFKSSQLGPESLDHVVSRAMGNIEALVEWSRGRLSSNGRVILWLGAGDAGTTARIGGWDWDKPVVIPGTNQRMIVAGSRINDSR